MMASSTASAGCGGGGAEFRGSLTFVLGVFGLTCVRPLPFWDGCGRPHCSGDGDAGEAAFAGMIERTVLARRRLLKYRGPG